MSSISVYGDFHSELSIPITREPKPIDSYGIGKLRDERLFISNCHNIDILRLMLVYAKTICEISGNGYLFPILTLKFHFDLRLSIVFVV